MLHAALHCLLCPVLPAPLCCSLCCLQAKVVGVVEKKEECDDKCEKEKCEKDCEDDDKKCDMDKCAKYIEVLVVRKKGHGYSKKG